MSSVQLLRVSMLALTAAILGGCAGGGGGGGSGPIVSPPPPPPPPPPPVVAVLLGPFAAVTYATGTGDFGGANSNVHVDFRDPDAPNSTTYEQLNIDGDETFEIHIHTGTTDFIGAPTGLPSMTGTIAPGDYYTRQQEILYWDAGQYQILRLHEGDSGVLDASTSYDSADYVAAFRWGSLQDYIHNGTKSGFQLLGTRAAGSSIPTTGSANFLGDAYGMFVPSGAPDQRGDFLGRAALQVNFSAGTMQGGVQQLLPVTTAPNLSVLDFNFSGTVSGATFQSTSVSFPLLTGTPSGGVSGQFYGVTGDLEAGGAFSVLAPGQGQMVGVFTAGAVTTPPPTDLSQPVRYGFLSRPVGATRNAGVASGPFNRIDFDVNGSVSSDDLIELHTTFPTGLQTLNLAVAFGASSVQTSGAPALGRMTPEFWSEFENDLYRYPLVITRDGHARFPVFAQALEWDFESFMCCLTQAHFYTTTGELTLPGAMPATGEAIFLGQAVGSYRNLTNDVLGRVTGDAAINVDFAGASIRGAINHFVAFGANGGAVDPTLNFTGEELSFSAPLSQSFTSNNAVLHQYANASTSTFAGTVVGEFYGNGALAASELGGSFGLTDPGVAQFAGAFVTGRNPAVGINTNAAQHFSNAPAATNFVTSVLPLTGLDFTWTRGGPSASDDTAALAFTRGATSASVTTPDAGQYVYRHAVNFDPGGGAFVQYEHVESIGGPFRLDLVETIAGVDLNYASFGQFRSVAAQPTAFFAFGQRTATMPTTGTASYNGEAIGEYRLGAFAETFGGRFNMDANFATGALSGALNMADIQAFFPGVNADFTFAGTIAGSGFTSPFSTADGIIGGTIGGVFAGPNAAEVAGTFSTTTSTSGAVFEGGFVGRR